MDNILNIIYLIIFAFISWYIIRTYILGKRKDTIHMKDALLSPEELQKHAIEIARNHVIDSKGKSIKCLISNMNNNYKLIFKVYKHLIEDQEHKIRSIPAAEWLLDNFYIIEQQVKEIRRILSKGHFSKLPTLKEGNFKGYPRIYALAVELVSHTDSWFDEESLVSFVKSYQTQSIISNAELWSIPVILRIAIIENIRNICVKIFKTQKQIVESQKMLNILTENLNTSKEKNIKILEEYLKDIKVTTPSYTVYLLKELKKYGNKTISILKFFDKWLYKQDTTIEEIIQKEHQKQAIDQTSIGNSIVTLKLLSEINWSDTFELLSKVEEILSLDPAKIYPVMDFESKDFYRHEVEDLAKLSGINETHIARKVVECAKDYEKTNENGEDKRNIDLRYQHVGYYLVGRGRKTLEESIKYKAKGINKIKNLVKAYPNMAYIGSIVIVSLIIIANFIKYAYNYSSTNKLLLTALTTIAIFIPTVDIVVSVINWIVTHTLRPNVLAKMNYEDGIPDECATMVTIPTLLTNPEKAIDLIEKLEMFYLANKEKNLYFSIIGDYKDAEKSELPGEEEIAQKAVEKINQLNNTYAKTEKDIFYYCHRKRQYNNIQGKWMGWERKRGAILEFNDLLRGSKDTSFYISAGNFSSIQDIKYVLTLDADTILPQGTIKSLIGAISHPLNEAGINKELGIVTEGYGLIQPRINVSTIDANKSIFSKIFGGQGGLDVYTTAVSDIYQDLFEEGIFTGKGIYNIDIFQATLKEAIPENTILSHDLLEGCYIRTGLVTDLHLIDGYPSRYNSYAARMHRWVRGDWQLIPWLKSKVKNNSKKKIKNPLSILSRWKILDNMRRSLSAPSLMFLLILSFGILPGNSTVWLLLAIVNIAFSLLTATIEAILGRSYRFYGEKLNCPIIYGFKASIYKIVLLFVFLPHQAYLMIDAIIRTLVRVIITKKKTLEWVTAADIEKSLTNDLLSSWKDMWYSILIAGIVPLVAILKGSNLSVIGFIFFMAWFFAPYITYKISIIDKDSDEVINISNTDKQIVRRLARKMWGYFEDFVDIESNHLPPDNYQENPPNGLDYRSSPTNIGLALISTLAARDLGYLSIVELYNKLNNAIQSINKLEKWNGHLYNWYNIKTLETLKPAYISTVDSGNFVGYLITLKNGLKESLNKPLINVNLLSGLIDTISLVENSDTCNVSRNIEILNNYKTEGKINLQTWNKLIKDLLSNFPKDYDSNIISQYKRKKWNYKYYDMLISFKEEIERFAPWLTELQKLKDEIQLLQTSKENQYLLKQITGIEENLQENLSLKALVKIYKELQKETDKFQKNLSEAANEKNDKIIKLINSLNESINIGELNINSFIISVDKLIQTIEKIEKETEFIHLYDDKRELFSIGYNIEEGRLTKSYYDLLASEARQASFIAIAKGEISYKHWFQLGRSLTMVDAYKGLVSWTGTMFEYLMPLFIMKNYKNTLWDEAYKFVIRSQKSYGKKRNVPWGTSESGYYSFDANLSYQYKAFGVPELGLKRGLSDHMVVAPYASIMALMLDGPSAIQNIKKLEDIGAEGPYGLYEAIDYTPERIPYNNKVGLVQSFMVHHLGMSIMAIVNFLNANIMQERFHSEPIIKSVELLLQERVPTHIILTKEHKEKIEPFKQIEHHYEETIRVIEETKSYFPQAHILSNGNYSVMLTDKGSGYSKNKENFITRWRSELGNNAYGTFFYIQNINTNKIWSATYYPYYKEPEDYKVTFSADKAEFIRTDDNIVTNTSIIVSAEEDAEIRKLSLTNKGNSTQTIEITTYFELVLTSHMADVVHPAFSNLFVRTEYKEQYKTLIANRRPRYDGEKLIWASHTINIEGDYIGDIQYETYRGLFIGRGKNLSNVQVLDGETPLTNTVGPVLDPIMSLRCRIEIQAGETAHISYITAISESHKELIKIVQKYQENAAINRAFEFAKTRSKIEAKYLELNKGEEEIYQNMIPHILFISPLKVNEQEAIVKNTKGQTGLWEYGISGDAPIILLTISQIYQLSILQEMLKAHEYWRMKGLFVDIVILNEYEEGYTQPLHDSIRDIISISHARHLQNKVGGIFVIQAKNIKEEDKTLLYASARLIIRGEKGNISKQIKVEEKKQPQEIKKEHSKSIKEYTVNNPDLEDLLYDNGFGGFNKSGNEYIIQLKEGQYTPAPWTNIIANPKFGFQVSELGSGYTWYENSSENKLTPWSNDPIKDSPGEVFYLVDNNTGEEWTITPLPIREKGPYIIRHGFGYTSIEHDSHGLKQTLTQFVAKQEPVKINIIKLINKSEEEKNLSMTYYIRPVLGVTEEVTSQYITTRMHPNKKTILVENNYNSDYKNRMAFIDVTEKERTYTGDREEFMGTNGDITSPQGLKYKKFSNFLGGGHDPCVAVQINLNLQAGQEKEIIFLLGQSKDSNEINTIVEKYTDINNAKKALQEIKEFWQAILGDIKVKTPDLSMDIMLNGWLLYQTLSCRMWARTAFYQSGGAYGYRDQLQDVMGLVYVLPELTYSQILRHAAHQFIEGDVQHWWHPIAEKGQGADKGIRTRFSDDLLWLPFVTAHYINVTGDYSILEDEIYYIEDEPLDEGEDERYNIPKISKEKSSIYEHCIRAIEKSLKFGENGLPLMGSGDWNDGMSTVGNKGKGESVWLGWFIYSILIEFIEICEYKKNNKKAEKYKTISSELKENIEKNAWDGAWYRRAYFDDGRPMGSAENLECKIDSISQSWSIISGAAKKERSKIAMEALENYLIKRDEGLIKLLTPPFDKGDLKPGYIKGYVPGVRENGGQYTHAATWVIIAFALLGEGKKAWEFFNLINPINHTRTLMECARYKVEPYVMAADVYTVAPHVGRGGWTWYTGASSWMYRAGIEYILGFKKRGNTLEIQPSIPEDWNEYIIEYMYKQTKYIIKIDNSERVSNSVKTVILNGKVIEDKVIHLNNDKKTYNVEVIMGR